MSISTRVTHSDWLPVTRHVTIDGSETLPNCRSDIIAHQTDDERELETNLNGNRQGWKTNRADWISREIKLHLHQTAMLPHRLPQSGGTLDLVDGTAGAWPLPNGCMVALFLKSEKICWRWVWYVHTRLSFWNSYSTFVWKLKKISLLCVPRVCALTRVKDVRAQKTSHPQIFLKLWLRVENYKTRLKT